MPLQDHWLAHRHLSTSPAPFKKEKKNFPGPGRSPGWLSSTNWDRIGYCVYRLRINGGGRGRRTAISTSRCGPSFSEPPGPLLLLRGPSTLVVFPCSNGATVAGNGVGAVGAIGAFRPAVRFRFGLRPVREVVRGLSEETTTCRLSEFARETQPAYVGSRFAILGYRAGIAVLACSHSINLSS